MVKYVKGNLLDSDCDYICHQVNCQGRMASGIAKQIRERWPIVYKVYKNRYDYHTSIGVTSEDMLGNVDLIPIDDAGTRFVFNMYSQADYGYDGKRYTSYDGFWSCLGKILESIPKGSKIGFPDHIGCSLGGANWEVIRTMIEQALGNDFDVYIYKLEV
jgi:O-acetyl-ADP-ribose deacetylase (regulator of RNase III)